MDGKHTIKPISFENETNDSNSSSLSTSSQQFAWPSSPCMEGTTALYNPGFFIPSQQAIDRMAIEGNHICLQGMLNKQEFYHKESLLDKKAENDRRRDKAMQELKINREQATWSAFENGDGQICTQICLPTGEIHYSKPVIAVLHMKAFRIVDIQEEVCFYAIKWDGHGLEKISPSVKEFIKTLENFGIPILVGRDRKMFVADLVLNHLLYKAERIKLPRFKGWNKTDKGWHFVQGDECTIDSIYKGGEYV